MPPRLFCFGLGYSATRLAARMAAQGFEIAGTTRDVAAKRASLQQPGWALHRFDADAPLEHAEQALAGTTHLLHSIMPGPDGDPVLRWHAALIDALPRSQLRWIGYLSTTGVYGDHGGAWVNEHSPRRPSKPRTQRRLVAEDAWLERGARVFRLAGIYGPGRSAIERVLAGTATRVIKPGKVFNRIHVDDITRVLAASIERSTHEAQRPTKGRAYNVSDGHPASSADVLAHAAALLGVEPPPAVAFEAANMSAMARSFWQDDVRVANDRLQAELGVELRYPDYRAGLEACLRSATAR
ncbi:Nucleoside-diphosphate-sugar epimerase [Enhygromyxa salina]|uniref:Nucleoside-diphosphate-sugar epimerase n=1 Tax=Enhygromyxa salina TaxID=215803 RepID=A0A0C1ZB45_9BACT|nr:SDR family oxidoreductase [Enhygromyxa salina]KIG14884.1 Nucleoside-diphosphate-sugar epimerase [Enhygromyxa salina]